MINVTRHGTVAPISTAGFTAVGRARPGRLGATTVALLVLLVVALVQATPAFAADPDNVSLTLEGCKEPAIPASYNPPADLVCSNGDYTTGNLGIPDLPAFLKQADLTPVSIDKVNIPKIWTIITVVKD